MSNSRRVVELFYDVISPYSWLAFEVLCCYRNVWNIDLKFKPAFLGGVIYGSDSQPAVVNPSKLMYMVSDLKLASEYFGVPMFQPSKLSEKDSLNAMRFVTAVAEKGKEGDTLERVSRELWTRKWRTHQDITQPASLTDAGLKAGLSANEVEEILTLSISQPIKDKLKSVTEEALEYKERSGWGLTLTSLQPRCDHYSSILCLSEQLLNTILKYCKFTFFIQQQTHTHTHKIKKS
ncbi:glutathione S-transferase kappa 1-like isoform X1 [Sinocyclocheilus rhinocerous]|uniref:Glutathione S-transferase kappa 1 n=1 Tax=Sinocyclocheilus rhinocerous TaxID=307959 RepID=A0A673KAE6_9TELE|nr:PREDICTED: glutathione S-transferase kappa 1-like isoform X1 [Sinocyclocheilus rhinocerous]